MSIPDPNSSFYLGVRARMLHAMQAAKLDEQIADMARTIYEQGLKKETIVLSRSEKERLFQQTLQAVLLNMLAKLEN